MKKPIETYNYKPRLINLLSEHLTDGTLVLFLGAGTSRDFGLPSWVELVNVLRSKKSLPLVDEKSYTADSLQDAADEIVRATTTEELIKMIQEALYPVDRPIVSVFQNELLIAVAALLMGSKRGRVTRVVTLNYDNMLEWFLSLFGFVVKTIHTLPELEGSEDVRIYHPHGFIPDSASEDPASDFVILGMDHADMRLSNPSDPWFEMVRQILKSGFCLFLGMSHATLQDRALSGLFLRCGQECEPTRQLGAWLLLSKEEPTPKQLSDFQSKNIIVHHLDDPAKVPEFLMEICQEAAKNISAPKQILD